MKFSLDLSGDERLERLLVQAGSDAGRAVAQALYEEAQLIFAESQRLVPVDTGSLRSSGNVTLPQPSAGGGVEVTIGYGGAAAPYAAFVHENLNARHNGAQQAKYLEVPVARAVPDMQQRISDRVERLMK